MPQLDTDIVQIAQEIKRYLQTHPHAADSVSGIARWWLTRQRYQDALDKVNMALDLLVRQSLVVRASQVDGRTIYKFNSDEKADDVDSSKMN